MKHFKNLIVVLLSILGFNLNAQEWKALADSAKLAIDQKDNVRAAVFLSAANDKLKTDSSATNMFIANSNEVADLYVGMGQYAKAIPYYTQAKAAIEKLTVNLTAEYASVCNNLGRTYRLSGQLDKAEPLLIEAKDLREKLFGKENADYATSVNNLGVVYVEAGMYDVAKLLYIEAMEIRERVVGKESIDYATSCNNLAILYIVTGHRDQAEPLYINAKKIREKVLGKSHPFYAASCNNLAALYLESGNYREAEKLYLEAKEIREKSLGKDHPEYAASCDNLAILYMDLGKYEQAEALYNEARNIRERSVGNQHPDYAKGCNNLGLLYRTLGQYKKAEKLFIEARTILATTVGLQHFEYAKICNNLGALYMDMGDYDKAGLLYQEAGSVWEKVLGVSHPEYAKSLHNLALVKRNKGDLNEAEALFLRSLEIREKAYGKEHAEYANGCENLAIVYSDLSQYDKASAFLHLAASIKNKIYGKQHPEYLQSCINLANLYRVTKQHDSADIFFREAFAIQQSLVKNIFSFSAEPEKNAYLQRVNEYRNYFLSYSNTGIPEPVPSYAYNVSLATRNIVLTSSQMLRNAVFNSLDTANIALFNDWIHIREQLAFWYSKPLSEQSAVPALEERLNSIEKKLSPLSGQAGLAKDGSSWEDIRNVLKRGEAAIEFISFQYYDGKKWTDSTIYAAALLRFDAKEPELIHLFERKELDKLAGATGMRRVALLYSTTGKYSSSLYDLIWKPIETKLQGITTIYFAPAGELHKIAFHAIPVNGRELLSDKYRLVQVNSTETLVKHTDIKTGNGQLYLYGGVNYDVPSDSLRKIVSRINNSDLATRSFIPVNPGAFSYLLQTEKEVKQIALLQGKKNLNVHLSTGIEANEESIKRLSESPDQQKGLQTESPEILHVASHGFFFPDPLLVGSNNPITSGNTFRTSSNPLMRAGIAFAGANNTWSGNPANDIEDGILTAYEVSNMNLRHTRLAVLSACETGLGSIQGSEGVYGLQRAFKIAGVQYLIMSLWKVPDIETSEFMQVFYKNLLGDQTVENAFYAAQNEMKLKYRLEPFKWAAWILVQ